MTDFEIVEIGNEQRRHEAAIMAQEEAEAAQRQLQEEVHDIIDTHLVIAMLLNSIFPNNVSKLWVLVDSLIMVKRFGVVRSVRPPNFVAK